MDIKKRKEYFILTTVSFAMGFLIFGMMAVGGKELLGIPFNAWLALLIYGFGGLINWWINVRNYAFCKLYKKKKISFQNNCMCAVPFNPYADLLCRNPVVFTICNI